MDLMHILGSALITFISMVILLRHVEPQTMRRIVGYPLPIDLLVHGTIIVLFHGTFQGLMQAESAAIMFTLWLRTYRALFGYERYARHAGKRQWLFYPGFFTKALPAKAVRS